MSKGGGGVRIRMALLSVSDKTGIEGLAKCLVRNEIGIVSTGGTAKALKKAGMEVTDVSEMTGKKESFGGRVKTLDQSLLGSILFDRTSERQAAELAEMGMVPIDLVVVNFYDFQKASSESSSMEEIVESIDIGGPTMVRSAAKNHRHVAVVVDPGDYPRIVKLLDDGKGVIAQEELSPLAAKAFATTAAYEDTIAVCFAERGDGKEKLRYGENPHQKAAVVHGASTLVQIGGAELSYNNLQDAIFAWRAVSEHERPACVIVKHAIPCAVATADTLAEAYEKAHGADPVSAYGGVVATNVEMDADTLVNLRKTFFELIVCPSYSNEATEILSGMKRLRSLVGPLAEKSGWDSRVYGGIGLCQEQDRHVVGPGDLDVVTKAQPDKAMVGEMLFALKVVKHVRSNAIAITKGQRTIGLGAGQTSRVDAVKIAVARASERGFGTSEAIAASDAFFPFADGIEPLAKAKIAGIVQPGGSRRDKEVIKAANDAGIVMAFTGVRHFSH